MNQRAAKVDDRLVLISCPADHYQVWVIDQPWAVDAWRCECRKPGQVRGHGTLAVIGVNRA